MGLLVLDRHGNEKREGRLQKGTSLMHGGTGIPHFFQQNPTFGDKFHRTGTCFSVYLYIVFTDAVEAASII